ncbi:MAG: amidohydrolase family protein [Candidatus Delongbacteria bacterium]|jgi:cytosine/adenosine deaminase-related metal-dependent hydrolase|nr:amidohydrolase family protein [Candidatus Delongbacteria bacterium]
MRQIAASMAYDGYQWIKSPLIRLDDNDMIVDVGRFDPKKSEPAQTEYYHGILTPGFINAHVHLELSFKDAVFTGKSGMSNFIRHVRWSRKSLAQPCADNMVNQVRKIKYSGTVAVSDVMNSGHALNLLEKSALKHIGFFEYYMLNEKQLQQQAEKYKALVEQHPEKRIYPALHAPYTISASNISMLKKIFSGSQEITSIHFKESSDEIQLYQQKGELYNLYRDLENNYQPVVHHDDLVQGLFEIFRYTDKIMLVHNTFITNQDINNIENLARKTNKTIAFVLCPRSNYNISGVYPPYNILRKSELPLMLGTDSLLSVSSLSIFDELMFVHHGISDIPLGDMLQWITINPARFFGLEKSIGSLRPGKKPGINLIYGKGVNAEHWPENAELKVLV